MIRTQARCGLPLAWLLGPHPLKDCTYHIGVREVEADEGIQVTGGQPCG